MDSRQQTLQERPSSSTSADAILIVKQYLEAPIMLRSQSDIYGFWNKYECKPLKNLARKILIATGSSVPSERVFSVAGNIISEKRSRLKPAKYNMLIFLKYNSWLY